MKKFLVLVMVLGLVSVSNAALVWDIQGNTGSGDFDVMPGDIIVATLTATTGSKTVGVSLGIVRATNDSGVANGAFTGSSINAEFDAAGIFNGWSPSEATAAGLTGSYTENERLYLVGTNGSTTGILGTIVTLNYTVSAEAKSGDVITVAAFTGEYGSGNTVALETDSVVMPTFGMNVVPEPITVALLGLGGLFVRRK